MAQTFINDTYAGGHNASTDLTNIEANFAALKSSFSGTTAPASAVEGMVWRDTTKHLFKEYTGSAWIGLMHGDAAHKVWIYRNAALTGWVVDGTVTDKVLSLKGGSTYTAGAVTSGTWTGLAHTHAVGAHAHQIYNHIATEATNDQYYNSSGNATNCAGPTETKSYGNYAWPPNITHTYGSCRHCQNVDMYTKTGGTAISGSSGSDATWRPAAAVGTLQYLDV